jgi:spore coat polysaccharide biosynthesis protein SpsF
MGSTRLPNKALVDLAGKPALARVIERLQVVPSLDGICIATTTLPEDDAICECAVKEGAAYHRGDSEDVLGRLLAAAKAFGVENVIYITADCPLVDPAIVERAVQEFRESRCDYASNRLHGYAYPIGMDVEVFTTNGLNVVHHLADRPRDREHVTTYFYEHPWYFGLHSIEPPEHHRRPDLRLTLDTWEDLDTIRNIYNNLDEIQPSLGHILALLDRHPELIQNADVEQVIP